VRVFRAVERAPISAETPAAATHAMSQPRRVGCRAATSPHAVATPPIRIRPQPENAENAAALSMVSRMKRRSAIARAWRADDSEIGSLPALEGMESSIASLVLFVKYFEMQS